MCNCYLFFKIEGYFIILDKIENVGTIIILVLEVFFIKCEGEYDLFLIEIKI